MGDLLGFNETTLYEEYNLSPNPVDFLSFDNISLECDIAEGMIFKSKRSGIILNWTMTVDPGYRYVRKVAGGFTWYLTESKHVISSICLKLENENIELVSFNGQSVTFNLSIKKF